jgi:MFS family permease
VTGLERRHLTVLIGALMAIGIGQSLVFAILAPLGREVALSELQITSIIALSALVFGVVSPAWGRLSDRIGRKPVIITGLLGYTVGTLAFTSVFYAGLHGLLAGTILYVVALLVRCSQSIVMSATNPGCTAYAADHTTPAERTRAMAKLGTANSMGMILGPAVSGALATLGLLAPLYFAAGLAAAAALMIWRQLPVTPARDRNPVRSRKRLRFFDRRIRRYVLTAVALFTGFSAIQQTLGFQLQDKLGLDGVATAQATGAALMVSASFTFLVQVTAMQRLRLSPETFMRLALVAGMAGAGVISIFETYLLLAIGMAFVGIALGLCMPAVTAGASLAVSTDEQGGAAGVIGACPAIGFVSGPIVGGALYQVNGALAPLFGAMVFFLALLVLTFRSARTPVDDDSVESDA